jgi:hypothetical protein
MMVLKYDSAPSWLAYKYMDAKLTGLLSAVVARLYPAWSTNCFHKAAREQLIHIDEPPSLELGTSRSLYPGGQYDVQIRQVLVTCLEDERSVIQ